MIAGLHAIIFCEHPDEARIFFRDVLDLDSVDAGDGFLIFRAPPAELAMHPEHGSQGRHELFLMCHDLAKTMRELSSKGVEFVGSVSEQRWGKVARLRVPGAGELSLYQPSHPSPLSEFPGATRDP
ncbi:MAG TPA: VOC family protein [Candidatus Dormibacteraeota bacterium]|nr:VOC family protein [Candidatus Dormibacteraeota bacterium]